MPSTNNDLLRSTTTVENITFADYTVKPGFPLEFFFNKTINVPANFNAFELLVQTTAIANLNSASLIPQYEITKDVFVNLTTAVIGLPSVIFPGLLVPSVTRLTLGMPTVGMLNINTVVFSPDGTTSIPMYGALGNSQARAFPITHPIIVKFTAITLAAPISLAKTLSLTFFKL